jgi:hypothetical protein
MRAGCLVVFGFRNDIQALEAKAKRFRKPIPTELFAYHIGR